MSEAKKRLTKTSARPKMSGRKLQKLRELGEAYGKSNKTRKVITHVAILLDQSGSMNRVRDTTVRGYNEQAAAIRNAAKAAKAKTFVNLTLFNGQISYPVSHVAAKNLQDLPLADYQPSGSTRLYDAILETISRLEADVKDGPEVSYLVVVLTDGQDTASAPGSLERVREKVTQLQETGRWTFSVIGANIRLDDLAATGIALGNLTTYVPDAAGTAQALHSNAVGTLRLLQSREAYAKGKRETLETSSFSFYSGTDNDPNV